jgi:hypothetical protein
MVAFAIVFAAFTPSAFAQKNYGPGVSHNL